MKKTLVALVLVSTGLFIVIPATRSLLSSGGSVEDSESGLAVNRIWIDHLPKSDKDVCNAFAVLTEEAIGETLGVFHAASQWTGSYEAFRYEPKGDEFRVVYPQTGKQETIRLSAKRCTEMGMDFCLELSGSSHGVKRYYSLKGWEIDHASRPEEIRARVESLTRVAE